jgi:hypothetical protein
MVKRFRPPPLDNRQAAPCRRLIGTAATRQGSRRPSSRPHRPVLLTPYPHVSGRQAWGGGAHSGRRCRSGLSPSRCFSHVPPCRCMRGPARAVAGCIPVHNHPPPSCPPLPSHRTLHLRGSDAPDLACPVPVCLYGCVESRHDASCRPGPPCDRTSGPDGEDGWPDGTCPGRGGGGSVSIWARAKAIRCRNPP